MRDEKIFPTLIHIPALIAAWDAISEVLNSL
jgi:hypothetical protein